MSNVQWVMFNVQWVMINVQWVMSNRLLIDIKNVAKLQHFKAENKRFNI